MALGRGKTSGTTVPVGVYSPVSKGRANENNAAVAKENGLNMHQNSSRTSTDDSDDVEDVVPIPINLPRIPSDEDSVEMKLNVKSKGSSSSGEKRAKKEPKLGSHFATNVTVDKRVRTPAATPNVAAFRGKGGTFAKDAASTTAGNTEDSDSDSDSDSDVEMPAPAPATLSTLLLLLYICGVCFREKGEV